MLANRSGRKFAGISRTPDGIQGSCSFTASSLGDGPWHASIWPNAARLLLALTLVAPGFADSARAQDAERRLEQYRCVLRLPGPDFTWLSEDDLPGATLACRDTKNRLVMLIVAVAPPGYYIDARQGAAYDKGMDRKPGIERLGSRLTEFLGVPCYEIRGRLKADQSLTLTRMFAANGFHYNLQAMIPAPPGDAAGKFDDLFNAFQFIDPAAVPETAVSTQPATAPITPSPPPASAQANQDVDTVPEVRPSPNPLLNPLTQAAREDGLLKATEPPRARSFVTAMTAGGLLGIVFSVILLWMFRRRP